MQSIYDLSGHLLIRCGRAVDEPWTNARALIFGNLLSTDFSVHEHHIHCLIHSL